MVISIVGFKRGLDEFPGGDEVYPWLLAIMDG